MSPQDVIEKMNLRLQSGNSVPVESSRITKEEWEVVKSLLRDENDGLAKQETIKQLREERNALSSQVEQLTRERDGWIDSAAQFLENQAYYRGLVVQIGELFGQAAYTSDDGSTQENVLSAKVPELVEELAAHVERLRAALNYSNEYLYGSHLNSIGHGSKAHIEMANALEETPNTSLARLKAQWQVEVLEELLQNTSQFREANPVRGLAGSMVDELRRQGEGLAND